VATRWYERLRSWIGRPSHAQATVAYTAILVATNLVLDGSSPRLNQAILESASTNLHQLHVHPVNVLITSALFVTGWDQLLEFAVVALLILSPLEQRIGTVRTIAGFAVGHIGASIAVAFGLNYAVHAGAVSPSIVRTVDVGVSYGTLCLVAAFAYLLVFRSRAVVLVGLFLYELVALIVDNSYTQWGHMISLVLGTAVAGPLLVPRRREAVRVPQPAQDFG
jgi:hypothetical protein